MEGVNQQKCNGEGPEKNDGGEGWNKEKIAMGRRPKEKRFRRKVTGGWRNQEKSELGENN